MSDTASKILEIFDGDGMRWELADGRRLIDIIDEHKPLTTSDNGSERHEFADGSAIVFCEGAWDVGFTAAEDCYCWAGVACDYPETDGHNPTCSHAHA